MIRNILARASLEKSAFENRKPKTTDLFYGAIYMAIGTYLVQTYLRAANREMQAALATWMFRREERAKALRDEEEAAAAYPAVDDLDPLGRRDQADSGD